MSDFARWLNGSLTRFCGHEMHAHCHGIIHTLGIESSCLCDCHQRAAAPQPLDVERLIDVMDWHMDSCLLKHRTRTNLERCIPQIADEYERLSEQPGGEA